eukprot:TRINITY_DN16888_c0_g1_i1.p1 TRINITY_DN16888_c0_g1~~TRINITY_DN16888_c0_g1_i1.p1  ORF type:complete len:145 (-),score=0.51 TRINITY_DN16888_c0_g1_i1:87-500(-)
MTPSLLGAMLHAEQYQIFRQQTSSILRWKLPRSAVYLVEWDCVGPSFLPHTDISRAEIEAQGSKYAALPYEHLHRIFDILKDPLAKWVQPQYFDKIVFSTSDVEPLWGHPAQGSKVTATLASQKTRGNSSNWRCKQT